MQKEMERQNQTATTYVREESVLIKRIEPDAPESSTPKPIGNRIYIPFTPRMAKIGPRSPAQKIIINKAISAMNLAMLSKSTEIAVGVVCVQRGRGIKV